MVFNKKELEVIAIPKKAAEILLSAPAGAIKLYLYGLLHEEAEIETIAKETGISEKELLQAIEELTSAGLWNGNVETVGEARYCQVTEEEGLEQSALYCDKDYNALLQALFTDRLLSYNDYKTFYEIRDVYELPANVVLMLAEYCINRNRSKNRLSMAYVKEQARIWAEEGIATVALATEKMATDRNEEEQLKSVLKALGIIRKTATDQEKKLFQKWVKDWGFSIGAIRAAMVVTTKAQYPSMKYLDSILKDLYQRGYTTAADVTDYFSMAEEADDVVKEILSIIGAPRRTVTEEHRQKVARWQAMGFSKKEILYAAKLASQKGASSFEYLDMQLSGWRSNGLTELSEIEAFVLDAEEKRQAATHMLSLAGVNRQAGRRDIEIFEKYLRKYQMPEEVVYFAAECAYGLGAPIRAMDKILTTWKEAGVTTLAEAKERERQYRANKSQSKQVEASERTYTEEELDKKVKDPLLEIIKQIQEEEE